MYFPTPALNPTRLSDMKPAVISATRSPLIACRGRFRCSATAAPAEAASVVRTKNPDVAKVAVLGASGYTGAEVARLLAVHPNYDLSVMTADRQAGKKFSEVYPHLVASSVDPTLVKIDDVDFSGVDSVFCCLPHATTQKIIAGLPSDMKIVDLSADFRLRNVDTYKEWYGGEHLAPELQEEAVYGLTEVNREDIKNGRLIANPGCYPTSVLLPLTPLLKKFLIQIHGIVIDAKSGTTGAGRAPAEYKLYCEVTDGIKAYGLAGHRHIPEIEQGLKDATGASIQVSFIPHLMPMSRGMLSTIYVKTKPGENAKSLKKALIEFYADEPFVKILPDNATPETRHVRGSNFNFINVFDDRVEGQAVIVSVIDNLVKGASGQAIQNMNLIMGFEETSGLMQVPMFP